MTKGLKGGPERRISGGRGVVVREREGIGTWSEVSVIGVIRVF